MLSIIFIYDIELVDINMILQGIYLFYWAHQYITKQRTQRYECIGDTSKTYAPIC